MPLFFEHKNDDYCILVWHVTEPDSFFYTNTNLAEQDEIALTAIKSASRKTEFLVARYLLGRINIQSASIKYKDSGKPELISGGGISISHCKNYVAIIFCNNISPGIDVEVISERPVKIQQKFLNERELEWAQSDRTINTLLWSSKEALFKLCIQQGIDFKKQLFVIPEVVKTQGTLNCEIANGDKRVKTQVFYQIFEKIVLVWGLNHEGI